jgi:DNA-binding transcriptional LysR family regulator
MNHRLPITLNQLLAFLHIAEGGSFIEGASRYAISQPALTRIIQQLEETVGARLFDRDTRGTSLTPIGRELIVITRRLLNHAEEEFDLIQRLAKGIIGHIRIATLPTLTIHILPKVIMQYRKHNPNIEISVQEGPSDEVINSVLSGEADCGLVDEPQSLHNLSWYPLVRDEFGLVCRKDDPVLNEGNYSWSLFHGRSFISTSTSTGVRYFTDKVFSDNKITPKFSIECTQIGSLGHFISQGIGITALPLLSLPLLDMHDLVWKKLIEPIAYRNLGLITRAHATQSESTYNFIRLLMKKREL